jgi:hypothetical protein
MAKTPLDRLGLELDGRQPQRSTIRAKPAVVPAVNGSC